MTDDYDLVKECLLIVPRGMRIVDQYIRVSEISIHPHTIRVGSMESRTREKLDRKI
jgi:hypothetical protein